MKYASLDPIIRPYMTDSPTAPKFYSRSELLAAAGITTRQLSYYIQKGAVARPLGNKRAAQYTVSHLHQAQRVVELLKKHQVTVSQIGEAYASSTPGARAAKQPSPARSKSSETLIVHRLTEGIRIVVDDELLPTEKKLLAELLKVGANFGRMRAKLVSESITRENHLRQQVVPSRRRVGR